MLPSAVLLIAVEIATIRLEVGHQGELILGTVEEVPITIYAPEVGDERPLRVSVNVGSFGEVQRTAPGVYGSSYRLPKTKHPQVALVAVWRETGPNAPIAFLRIPLSGKTQLPIGTTRGSEVSVLVGDAVFGPVAADRRGRAAVPIVVPPGVLEVMARSTSGTTESQKAVPVDLPPYNRLTLAVTPHVIEADGRSSCIAHVFYDSDAPPPLDRVVVTAAGGAVAPLDAEGGHYRFSYVPAREQSAVETPLAARVEGDETSHAETVLSLGSPVPQQLSVRAPEGMIADGRSQGDLQILLMDRLGLGVPGRAFTATSADGALGEVRDLGEGRYALGYRAPSRYPANGRALISIAVRDRSEVAQSVAVAIDPPPWPAKASVSIDPSIPISDGSAFIVDVVATDFAGMPFERGLTVTVTASAALVSKPQHLGGGRYRAEVRPKEGAESVDIAVAHPSGRFYELHRTLLRTPPPALTVAVRAGAAYQSHVVPTGGIELGYRIPLGERRFTVFVGAGFRLVSQKLEITSELFPQGSTLTSRVTMFPIAAGASYDLVVGEGWRLYLGAAATLTPFTHRIEAELFVAESERGVGVGAEGTLGFEWRGFFAELAGGYTRIETPSLSPGPGPLAVLAAGYRLDLL